MVSPASRVAAIVLAAGYSRRMGAFKPLLPFGSHTVVEHVLGTLRSAGLQTVRVVVGWRAERLTPVLERAEVPSVLNERFAEGMFASVQAGVRALPPNIDAFFVLPADMPLVRRETLERLLASWDAGPPAVLYPCRAGRRGHPPLIPAAYIPEILAAEQPGGLRAVLARHAPDARDIECDDPGILMDLDTPEAYREALRLSELT